MCGQGILCYINFRIVLCGDYYLSGYFRWSDPSGSLCFADLFNAALFGGEQSVRILWRKRMGRSIFVKGHAGDSRENKTAGI